MQDPIAAPPTMPRNLRRRMMTSPLIRTFPVVANPEPIRVSPVFHHAKASSPCPAPAGRIPGLPPAALLRAACSRPGFALPYLAATRLWNRS